MKEQKWLIVWSDRDGEIQARLVVCSEMSIDHAVEMLRLTHKRDGFEHVRHLLLTGGFPPISSIEAEYAAYLRGDEIFERQTKE